MTFLSSKFIVILTIATACLAVPSVSGCSHEDMKCWTRQARTYTNDVRRRYGVHKMLRDGPRRQFANALEYASQLAALGTLQHQVLGAVTEQVGCGRWIGGENVAFNNEADGDIAKACVDQWEHSPPHLQNIVREEYDEVSVGFHYTSDGRVFCVQTFASISPEDAASFINHDGCESMSTDDVDGNEPDGQDDAEKIDAEDTDEDGLSKIDNSENHDSDVYDPKPDDREEDGAEEDDDSATTGDGEGSNSCRCLELGERCWNSLEEKTGGRCDSFVAAHHQPAECHRSCCQHCETHPDSARCNTALIHFLCQSMNPSEQ